MQEFVRRQRQTETDEQGAQCKKTDCECKTTKRKFEKEMLEKRQHAISTIFS
jgi:hypothetical protein